MENTPNTRLTLMGGNAFAEYLSTLTPIDGQRPSRSVIYQRTMELVSRDMLDGTLPDTIRKMLEMAGVDRFLPPQYAKYQKVVMEGAVFVLAHLPKEQIVDKLTDQLMLPLTATPGERIRTLVQDMPTLHKLSQIIGRSPGIDASLKQSLIDLEDNITTVSYETMKTALLTGLNISRLNENDATDSQRNRNPTTISKRLLNKLSPKKKSSPHSNNSSSSDKNEETSSNISVDGKILAEASVCAVIPGTISGQSVVFKMVKPVIKTRMAAELALWARLGDFLDEHKEEWGLGDFRFKGTIDQVSRLLQNEVDLNLEQENLNAVATYYEGMPRIAIPEKLPQSTPDVTVMTRLDAVKITDVEGLTQGQKRALAKKVARLCILQPIIDLERESIFHGDPHAGNIAYRLDDGCRTGGKPELVFYDWAMVGRLNRLERLAVVLMISGLILENTTVIYYAADIMSGGKITSDPVLSRLVIDLISQVIQSRESRIQGVLGSVENLIEQIMYLGVVFSPDLLVFEKSLVTLKGVLADIDPTFDRDEYIVIAAVAQFVSDVMHFKVQSIIIKEVWSLYKYSLSLFFEIQKTLVRFGWEMVKMYGVGSPAT